MRLCIAYTLTIISIILLVIYAFDVTYVEFIGKDFLDIDHATRGIGLGLTSVILPFIAYAVSRNIPSVGLGATIVISGLLLLAGGVAILGLNLENIDNRVLSQAAPIISVGVAITILGILKIRSSR